jgi:glucosamine--fructose-6-phosphate aminotransferase (isomerizing)
MCGIFGYVGQPQDVWGTVASALQKLEYRGYDSWGIAWKGQDSIRTSKDVGRIVGAHAIEAESPMAIGHTRWATHGGVTVGNAHPHCDCSGRITLVHNGIVENMAELAASLETRHTIVSQTDTEIIAHLLEEEVDRGNNISDAVRTVFNRLDGCNAIVVMHAGTSEMIVAKRVSPILLGVGEKGSFVTSDALALQAWCAEMTVMPDNTIAHCSTTSISLASLITGAPMAVETETVPVLQGLWTTAADSHFMDMEMRQQPAVLRSLVGPGVPSFDRLVEALRQSNEIVLTGCGSALFAARLGETYFQRIAGIRTTAIAASELEHMTPFFTDRTLVIALSQSGETADVVDAMIGIQRAGIQTAALVNVMHSTLSRMVDVAVPLGAGQEQCVLATKSWFAKVALLIKLAAAVAANSTHEQSIDEAATIVDAMLESPSLLAQILSISERLANSSSALVVGRGLGAATAQEVALKIKEASYVHAEAFAAGELKHGAIALVTEGIPCLILGGCEENGVDTDSTAHELLSRGGYTIGIGTNAGASFAEHIAIPKTGFATPLAQALIAQMLAYRTALAKGINPDRPRNLAKSVTVK